MYMVRKMVIKMKKINKILIVFVIIILLTSVLYISHAVINPENYKPSDPTQTETLELRKRVNLILGVVRNVSVVVSVIALMIIGIKYMLGSVEEKANYKATMMPYVIGCLLAASGTTLVSYIYDVIH